MYFLRSSLIHCVQCALIALTLVVLAAAPTAAQNGPRTPLASLGPLAPRIVPGQSGAWTAQDDNGYLILTNPAGAGAIRFYSVDWRGDLAAGRSASVLVVVNGQENIASAGLIFRILDEDPRWVAFVETAQGKVALYVRRPNELHLSSTYDIPGGHREHGDVLTINQQGNKAQLLVNGSLVDTLEPDSGRNPNAPAPVGVVAIGKGEFGFADFAFRPMVAPTASPPVASNDTPPAPQPPAPQPPPTAPPRSATTQAPQTATTGSVPSLGALGRDVTLGNNGVTTTTIENGQLVYARVKNDLSYFVRLLDWPTVASQGRSATLTVDMQAGGATAAAGIGFGIDDSGNNLLAFATAADGKIGVYRVKDEHVEQLTAFDPPQRQHGGGKHVLRVSQTETETTLYADGALLGTISGATARAATQGEVGIFIVGKGRYAFQDFAFGLAAHAQAAPPPPPQPQTRTADTVPSLGPLGHDVHPGTVAGFNLTVESGQLVFSHPSPDDLGVATRSLAWPMPVTDGRSATLTVNANGDGSIAAGGIGFAIGPGGNQLYILGTAADGQIKLYRIDNDDLKTLDSFDPPATRPGGGRHVLEISQTQAETTFLADGERLGAMPNQADLDTQGEVGIAVLGKGRFAFQDFAFGPTATPARP